MSRELDMVSMSCILDIMSNTQDSVVPVREPSAGLSFEEKSVWIQLLAMLAGLGGYFVVAGRLLASGERGMAAYAALFLVATAAMVVLMVVAYAAAALVAKPGPADERDRVIAWRAEYRSSWLVAAGVLGGVACMAAGVPNVWTANLLLLSLAGSEVLGFVLQLVAYRRGV